MKRYTKRDQEVAVRPFISVVFLEELIAETAVSENWIRERVKARKFAKEVVRATYVEATEIGGESGAKEIGAIIGIFKEIIKKYGFSREESSFEGG